MTPISDERLAELIALQQSEAAFPQAPTQWDSDVTSALRELARWRKLTALRDVHIIHRADTRVHDGAVVFTVTTGGKRYCGPSIPAALEAMRGEA